MRPLQWWAESAPPGGDRVKVSENFGANGPPCGYLPLKLPDLYQFLSKKIHETLASASVHDQHRRKASLKGSIRRSRSSHSRMADGM